MNLKVFCLLSRMFDVPCSLNNCKYLRGSNAFTVCVTQPGAPGRARCPSCPRSCRSVDLQSRARSLWAGVFLRRVPVAYVLKVTAQGHPFVTASFSFTSLERCPSFS